jgi:tetratricopeptide (TPR) repeat protein
MAEKIKPQAEPAGVDGPFDADELLALARLDVERGALDQALSRLKSVLKSPAPTADAFSMAARLYAQLGLYDRSQKLFQRYLQLKPESLLETFQLGMTHYDAGQPNEALNVWESILKQSPVHPPALFYKALVLSQTGKVADARGTLDVLLKSAPADNLYFGRAKELLQAIDAGQIPVANLLAPAAKEAPRKLAKDAYKTEH